MMEIHKAVRRALPLQLAFYGPEGSGKTMSALLFAAGLSPDSKVVIIDTEKGRASLYADNKRVLAALPSGFDVLELDAPYHPDRYREALDTCEAKGYKVCLIDSSSDSWNGPGGCEDITEANKGMWNKAKLANKKLMTRIKLSSMHVICCLKAQAKTKVVEGEFDPHTRKKKKEFIELGVLPICEKNFFYPMLLGFSVDPQTHLSTITKYHEDLYPLFKEPKLITKEDGAKVRQWNDSAGSVDANEQLMKRARSAAEDGTEAYKKFFESLTPTQRKAIPTGDHEKFKAAAYATDKDRVPEEDEPATKMPFGAPVYEDKPFPMDHREGDVIKIKDGGYW